MANACFVWGRKRDEELFSASWLSVLSISRPDECSEVRDVPLRIFEGCMHSVHISCLKGVSYCIICEKGITDAVKKLSVAASSSY